MTATERAHIASSYERGMAAVASEQQPTEDRRPYHDRRAEMARCPECLDPECFSIACDERGEDGR